MNYLWEVALKADDEGIEREKLQYIPAEICSPYIEVSFTELNQAHIENLVIEANPLYRFTSIFAQILNINLTSCPKTRQMLYDVCMQYMIQIDLREGMTKREYYLRFILRDILNKYYGDSAISAMKLFMAKERRRILTCMLTLYYCGSSIILFRQAMRAVYPESLVYANNEVFGEILIYIGKQETEIEWKKVDFLFNTFLPLDYTAHLFWEHHFGIIDIDVTMMLDEMELF